MSTAERQQLCRLFDRIGQLWITGMAHINNSGANLRARFLRYSELRGSSICVAQKEQEWQSDPTIWFDGPDGVPTGPGC